MMVSKDLVFYMLNTDYQLPSNFKIPLNILLLFLKYLLMYYKTLEFSYYFLVLIKSN